MTSFNEWLEQRDERFHENDDKPWKDMPQTRNYSQIAGFNDLMDGLHALRDELLLRRKSSKDVSPETSGAHMKEAQRISHLIELLETERLGESAVKDLVDEIENELVKYGLKKNPHGPFVAGKSHYHNYGGKSNTASPNTRSSYASGLPNRSTVMQNY